MSCGLRQSLRPLETREELERLKRYAAAQKRLALHLLKTQRSMTLEYLRRSPRDPEEIRSPSNEVLVQRTAERKPLSVPVIKFKSCSQLMAEGHGVAQLKHSTSRIAERSQQWNESIFNEEISLSRSTARRLQRTALVRRTPSKVSATYSFATPDRLQRVAGFSRE